MRSRNLQRVEECGRVVGEARRRDRAVAAL
jgi:hypothetical protein